MDREPVDDALPRWMAALLVLLPIVAGGLLFVLFDRGPVHDVGVFLIGAGVIVGGALLLLRWG